MMEFDVTLMPYKELQNLVSMLSCEVEHISKVGRRVVMEAGCVRPLSGIESVSF